MNFDIDYIEGVEVTILDPAGRYVLADYRQSHTTDLHYWHIHSPRVWGSIRRDLGYIGWRDKPTMVFLARNRTQIHEWMTEQGMIHQWQFGINQPERKSTMSHKQAALRAQMGVIAGELARIESYPDEPTDEPAVIYWQTDFEHEGSTVYDYAALRAGDGLWYTTGPRSPKGQTWDRLIDWIMEDAVPVDGLWIAVEYERVD